MRKTTRRMYQGVNYAIFVVLLLVIVLATDWERIVNQFFRWDVAREMLPEIITIALKNTILFTVISFAGGLLLGVVMALLKLSSVGPYRWFATAYIEFFRGVPALLTIFAMAYMLPIALRLRRLLDAEDMCCAMVSSSSPSCSISCFEDLTHRRLLQVSAPPAASGISAIYRSQATPGCTTGGAQDERRVSSRGGWPR
ncbi:ABC transporter permease subunit [Georgenia sp. SUBG003]|uniref:ABC transporter permease subunit n=1 Tax=Georgenia sp. SUBG003 TaxID=1497974 RepID=UPI003AB1469F